MASSPIPDFESLQDANSRRLDRSDLIQVRSLQEGFHLFGVRSDDVVDTREMVLMTSQIADDMRKAKSDLINRRRYRTAAKVRDRLENLNGEFDTLRMDQEMKRQREENASYERARNRFIELDEEKRNNELNRVEKECALRMEALLHEQEVQRQQLEDHINSMHRPRVRYSKRLLDMMHSEKHLAKLNQFEDARALNKHIQALEPREVERHNKAINDKIAMMRTVMRRDQEFKLRKLEEKLHDLKLQASRAQANQADLTAKRLSHHLHDMKHAHKNDSSHVEQFCAVRGGKVRPVITKRKGYKQTDSTFRGTQLLRSVQGDAIKDVASLCALHDFDNEDPDTIEYDPS